MISNLLPVLLTIAVLSNSCFAADVRDRAVVRLNFDDSQNPLAESSGQVHDQVSLPAGGTWAPSVFADATAGRTLLLDSDAGQYLQVESSADVKHARAVTVAGFFASLHPLTDGQFHGLFATRNQSEGKPTNYGINFQPSSDNFQLYVNNGSEYKVANYSVKATISYSRRVHLIASFDQGDAPGADADTDADDIRIRLFVNGRIIAPTKATGDLIDSNAAWIQDVSLEACVSDTPLIIGGSFAAGELTSLACDDFCIFAEAVSDQDAASLFQESAGSAAAAITAETNMLMTSKPAPQINRITPPALQPGVRTRVTVSGQNLNGATFLADIAGVKVEPAAENTDTSAAFEVTVPAGILPGRYLTRCVTTAGVSNAVTMVFDSIASYPEGTFPADKPAETFPIAITGVISGTEQKQIWLRGKAGQKLDVEVDARRLGSALDPVVEIRNESGGPLSVKWQQPALRGDCRATVTLPADGLYSIELHDLQYKAPGGSAWRMTIGDLAPSGLAYPSALPQGTVGLRTIGETGLSDVMTVQNNNGLATLTVGSSALALPGLAVVQGTAVTEPVDGTYAADPVDASFPAPTSLALFISGRISEPGQTDTVILKVTPGQTLSFITHAISEGSPLRPRLQLLNGDAAVAGNDGQAGLEDPRLTYTVPEKVEQLKLQINDVDQSGSGMHLYRIEVARNDRHSFLLSAPTGDLQLPVNGSVPIRLKLTRKAENFHYTGPVQLTLEGAAGLQLIPSEIPASETDQDVLVTLSRDQKGQNDVRAAESFRIIGTAGSGVNAISASVTIPLQNAASGVLTLPRSTFVSAPVDPVPAVILPSTVPPVLFRGLTADLPLQVLPVSADLAPFLRFELTSTEPERRADPAKPDSPLKPRVRLPDFSFSASADKQVNLRILVPEDLPSDFIYGVISADPVAHPLAPATSSRIWSAPLRLAVTNPVSVSIPATPLLLKPGAENDVTIEVTRHPLFSGPLTIRLEGLPDGYTAGVAELTDEQTQAMLKLSVPAAATGQVNGLMIRVLNSNGDSLPGGVAVPATIQ